jgi:hypothetical protein
MDLTQIRDFGPILDFIEEELAAKTPPNLAPYKIFKSGSKFVVKNNAGQTKASFDSRAQALAYQRALYANVKGSSSHAERTKYTGGAKRAS